MPRELPGFYYNEEKNRYFPIKGPLPGSSRASAKLSSQKTASKRTQISNSFRKQGVRMSRLLQARELHGNLIASYKQKHNFKEEIEKFQVSQPLVWKYEGTDKICDSALQLIHMDGQTLEGQIETDVLLTGSSGGSLSFFEVAKVGLQFDGGLQCIPELQLHDIKPKDECNMVPKPIFRPTDAFVQMPSQISSLKLFQNNSCSFDYGPNPNYRHGVLTTLGSEACGGSLYNINLLEPLDLNVGVQNIQQIVREIVSFNCTVWTADCNYNGSHAVIGTSFGSASVDVETGAVSWLLRSKSDVFAQQIVNSKSVVLCGLRNGMIITVDFRERSVESSSRMRCHRISLPRALCKRNSSYVKEWLKIAGNFNPTETITMPSSISCLASLQFDDQYFLTSSMDGTVQLFDHRLLQRGAVQIYEGHVNSHTHIQLGVDPSEKFVMSGGEDCYVRIWSIKSGKLVFEEKTSNSIPSTVCWPATQGTGWHEGAWLGSRESLFHMQWS